MLLSQVAYALDYPKLCPALLFWKLQDRGLVAGRFFWTVHLCRLSDPKTVLWVYAKMFLYSMQHTKSWLSLLYWINWNLFHTLLLASFFFTKLILGSFAFKALCKFSLFIFFAQCGVTSLLQSHSWCRVASIVLSIISVWKLCHTSINPTAQADKQAIKLGQPYYIPPYLNSKSWQGFFLYRAYRAYRASRLWHGKTRQFFVRGPTRPNT